MKCVTKFEPGEQLAALHVDYLSDGGEDHQMTSRRVTAADWPHGHCMWTVSLSELQSAVNPPTLLGVCRPCLPHSYSPSSLTVTLDPSARTRYYQINTRLTCGCSYVNGDDSILSMSTSRLVSREDLTRCSSIVSATSLSLSSQCALTSQRLIGYESELGRGYCVGAEWWMSTLPVN